jgi:uncharacterized protein YecT (DUF1311 family)
LREAWTYREGRRAKSSFSAAKRLWFNKSMNLMKPAQAPAAVFTGYAQCSTDLSEVSAMTNGPYVVLALLVGAVVLTAASGHPDERPLDCREGGRNQLEMNACAGLKADAANRRLAALVAELDGVLPPGLRQGLASIQKQWLALRDLDCKWEQSAFEGGSVAPLVYASCVASQTEQRIDRLKVFLCEGRGVTGPCEASRKY